MRHLKTARAWPIRRAFQEFYQQPSTEAGAAYFKRWYFWATHSRLSPVIDACLYRPTPLGRHPAAAPSLLRRAWIFER
jgi:hypothetical protein